MRWKQRPDGPCYDDETSDVREAHCARGVELRRRAVLPALAFAAELPTLPQTAPTSCFGSLYDFATASAEECPLTWNGVTLYGRIDVGVGYETHELPFNGGDPNGVETLISKNSNGSRTTILPNGLGQSNVGVKGDEPIAPDWSLVFNFQAGFNPYYPQLANGPRSLVQNNLAALEFQSANGDSSRAGQLFNTIAYAGINNRTFGEVTVGRHDSLILDGLGRYDAMGAAPAFSVIGASNTVAGAGDTENARYNTSVQYRVSIGPFRLAALYQFGGYDQGNGSNGAFDAQIGADPGDDDPRHARPFRARARRLQRNEVRLYLRHRRFDRARRDGRAARFRNAVDASRGLRLASGIRGVPCRLYAAIAARPRPVRGDAWTNHRISQTNS